MANNPISRRSFFRSSAASAAGLAFSGAFAAFAGDENPPNIIWLIGDDVGPKEIGCYGHPTIRTPNIDALAVGGVRFTNAFVAASSCSPSRCSCFTGKYPHSTGAENLHDPLPEGQTVLPRYLASAGYFSGSVGKFHMGAAAEKQFDRVLGKVENWKDFLNERPQNRPFFLSVGFIDAHRPFDKGCVDPPYRREDVIVPPYLPDIPEVRDDLAGFYDEISRMDRVIGEIASYLRQQELLDNTLIVFFGDNGIPFPRAKFTIYDSGIQTPLIVQWPAQFNGGQVYNGLISLVDLAPAMLQSASLPIPPEMEGIGFLELLTNPGGREREYIFAERNWHDFDDHSRAVRDQRFKYIRNAFPDKPLETSADSLATPMFEKIRRMRDAGTLTKEQMLLFRSRRAPEELYDLEIDPHEFRNIVNEDAYSTVLERMRRALDRWIEETHDIPPSRALPDEFDPETGKRIRPPHQDQAKSQ
ncbi:MAG: sulfatase-like hydrolase/transferase [Candidatus Omnitrophota bacterium]